MLSIHTRQVLAGLVLPILIFFAVGLAFVGQVWPQKLVSLRLAVTGEMAPIYYGLTFPQREVRHWEEMLHGVTDLIAENQNLRQQNKQLYYWRDMATSLKAENKKLKSVLHWGIDPSLRYVSGWVVREESGPYLHAALLDVGDQLSPHMGSLAVDDVGLIGRVSEVGPHVVRILLITDAASRIPVTMLPSGGDAMMVGDSVSLPHLMYYAQDTRPVEGARVETRGQAGITGGVLIGHVHYLSSGQPIVIPAADLKHLDVVRVFDNDTVLDPPPAAGRVREHGPLISVPPKAEGEPKWQGLKRFWPFSRIGNG
ncbi:rod shape-determining protein MreC [Saccharibacter sp. 17.LH.SD]|uniref:rod shape-determining protein MreC n=1 Tax=Saccharibacter sp. 17.LH.SD TaxID=2689393 RepID=UPI00136F8DC4|nr:rod shape-determining protein MreC [Saccharibacter sp. 17.LH.SD]MXV44026.1 rod shape-determining protein MreC [Saccharibacter sp. 17.LH.SD]